MIMTCVIINRQPVFAQTGSWKLAGNTLAGTEKIGSKNNFNLNVITNNQTRMTVSSSGNVGIGTTAPATKLDLLGPGNWDLSTSEGDFRIGNSTYRLKFGVALAGGGAGDCYIAAQGGTSGIYIGSGSSFNSLYTLSVKQGHIGIGSVANAYRLETYSFNNNDTSTIGWFSSADHSKGVSIGQNSVRALGSNSDIDLNLKAKGQGGIYLSAGGLHPVHVNSAGDLEVDISNEGNGTFTHVLKFGLGTGEGIGSNRTGTTNQYGLDFYTNFTNRFVITQAGNVGIGTTTPSNQLQLSLNSACKPGSSTWTICSDQRLKTNITDFKDGLDVLMKIHPVWFEYNGLANMPTGERFVGILAQEMQKVAPYMISACSCNPDGEDYLKYDANALFYILVNAVQEQEQTIADQKKQITSITEENKQQLTVNANLHQQIDQLTALVSNVQTSMEEVKELASDSKSTTNTTIVELTNARLDQNVPNPFDQSTTIDYYIPKSFANAAIQFISPDGEIIKSVPIAAKGNGQLILKVGELCAGTYQYSLIVDGKIIDTRQMILTK